MPNQTIENQSPVATGQATTEAVTQGPADLESLSASLGKIMATCAGKEGSVEQVRAQPAGVWNHYSKKS